MEINNSLAKVYHQPWFSSALGVTAALSIYLNLHKQMDQIYGKDKKMLKWAVFGSIGCGLVLFSKISPKLGNIISVIGIVVSTLWNFKKTWMTNEAFLETLFPGLAEEAKKIQGRGLACLVGLIEEKEDFYVLPQVEFKTYYNYYLCCKKDYCVLIYLENNYFLKIYVENKKLIILRPDAILDHKDGKYKVTFNLLEKNTPWELPKFKNYEEFFGGLGGIVLDGLEKYLQKIGKA